MPVVIRILLLVLVVVSAASASSSVKGTVVDPNGQSIFEARVLLLNPVDQKVLYETRVERGTFRFDTVAAQSYFINVKALGFREHADSVSVAQDQAVDMGRIIVSLGRVEEWFGGEPTWSAEDLVDAHVRTLAGIRLMTVCEYMNIRSQAPISYSWVGVTIIGILERTPQGSFLRQTCPDSLRSGDYSWPNAIALEEIAGSNSIPASPNWVESLHPTRPIDEELDPRDRKGHWAAFYGRLETRDKLVAVPCGNGKQCAYGFGAISAPARLLYQKWYDFGGTK